MRSQPRSWNNLLTQLGYSRNQKNGRMERKHAAGRKLRMETCEDRRMMAPLVVDSLTDDGIGYTLREAIADANASNDFDTITFAAGIGNTINLDDSQGRLFINSPVEILGPGADELTINQTIANAGVFDAVLSDEDLTISGLTITGGENSGIQVTVASPNATSQVSLSDLVLTGNSATLGLGGGLYIEASGIGTTVSVDQVKADTNIAISGGGIAIQADDEATVTVSNSLISNNEVTNDGGGIHVKNGTLLFADPSANVTIRDSRITNNLAKPETHLEDTIGPIGPRGGGIYLETRIKGDGVTRSSLANNEVSNNTAWGMGGGAYIDSWALNGVTALDFTDIVNTTFSSNHAQAGGGVFVDDGSFASVPDNVSIRHSTITANTAGNNWRSLTDLESAFATGGGGLFIGGTTYKRSDYPDNYVETVGPTIEHTIIAGNLDNSGGEQKGRNGAGFGSGNVLVSPDIGTDYNVWWTTGVRPTSRPDDAPDFFVDVTYSLIGNTSGALTYGKNNYMFDTSGQNPALADRYFGLKLLDESTVTLSYQTPVAAGLDPQLSENGNAPHLPDGQAVRTHYLLPGSAAIDEGNPGFGGSPATDQRGFSRVADGDGDGVSRIDIGALEVNGTPNPSPSLPRVANIIVSSTHMETDPDYKHLPFSYDTVVDGSGEQLRSVPVALADTVTIVFTEEVNIAESDFRIVGMVTGAEPTIPVGGFLGFDPNTNSATWKLEGLSLHGDNYLISLDASAITAVDDGAQLDGDWENPQGLDVLPGTADTFATSGDGSPGGDFNFVMRLMPGDADGNGVVDGTDFNTLAFNFNQDWSASDATFRDGDFDGDGDVDGDDYNLFAFHFLMLNLSQPLFLAGDTDGDNDVDAIDIAFHNSNSTQEEIDVALAQLDFEFVSVP